MQKLLLKLVRIYLLNLLLVSIILPVLATGASTTTPSILPVTITSPGLPVTITSSGILPRAPGGGLVPCEGLSCSICDLLVLVQNVINFVLQLVFWICIVIIIAGAFVWMLSFGNQKNITTGQKMITNAIIGLAIVLLAWLIINTFFWLIASMGGMNMIKSWAHLECY